MHVPEANAVVDSDVLALVDGELLMELLLIVRAQLIDLDVVVVGTVRRHPRRARHDIGARRRHVVSRLLRYSAVGQILAGHRHFMANLSLKRAEWNVRRVDDVAVLDGNSLSQLQVFGLWPGKRVIIRNSFNLNPAHGVSHQSIPFTQITCKFRFNDLFTSIRSFFPLIFHAKTNLFILWIFFLLSSRYSYSLLVTRRCRGN